MEALSRYPICVPVVEESQVGDARRSAVAMAASLGFDENRRGEVAIVVTELATNLARHAKGGEIILRAVDDCDPLGLEVMSIDRGPGIRSIPEAMRDGFSTGGTPGNGLGAIKRVAATFDIFTSPAGTAILAHLHPGRPQVRLSCGLDIGGVCLPVKRESACGDAWGIEETADGRTLILVADGLGHGIHAAEASRLAVTLFRENRHLDPVRLVEVLHGGLRSTRGAAVSIAEIRPGQKEINYVGVGNISGYVVSQGKVRSMVSHNGTVGAEMRRAQQFAYPWGEDSLLLLHSDGLTSQWNLQSYPGLALRHPSLIAGVLYRDFRRERDDVTVVVARPKAVSA